MRLGAYPAKLAQQPRRASMAATTISERHRHRYEVNVAYRERLEAGG
jgi:CTP synthase